MVNWSETQSKFLVSKKKYYENVYQRKGPGLINQKEFLAKQNIHRLSDMQKHVMWGPY